MCRAEGHFLDPLPTDPSGWRRLNAKYWSEHYEDFVEFFFGECFNEPHSTKPREDCVEWAFETTPDSWPTSHKSPILRRERFATGPQE